jgi:hypothetical protein
MEHEPAVSLMLMDPLEETKQEGETRRIRIRSSS